MKTFYKLTFKIAIIICFLIIKNLSFSNNDFTKGEITSFPIDNIIDEFLKNEQSIRLDLFVMSQCPYGIEAEKIIIHNIKKYDKRIVFNLFFIAEENAEGQFVSMHGEEEVEEDKRQIVISKLYPNKFLDYLLARAQNYISNDWLSVAQSMGMDVDRINLEMLNPITTQEFRNNIQRSINEEIYASPTLMINNQNFSGSIFSFDFPISMCCDKIIKKTPLSQNYSSPNGFEKCGNKSYDPISQDCIPCNGKMIVVPKNFKCCNGKICPPETECCGKKCMNYGYTCCNGKICPLGTVCCGNKCMDTSYICCNGKICPPGTECSKKDSVNQGWVKTSSNLPADPAIKITGFITDTANNPINEADIYITKGNQMISYAYSDTNGKYSITNFFQPISMDIVPQTDTSTKVIIVGIDSISKYELDKTYPNEYKIMASANGFKNEEKNIVINPNDSIKLNFVLKKLCSVSGLVTKNDKKPVSDALILLKSNEGKLSIAKTNQNGKFFIDQLEDGTYTISVSNDKYAFSTKIIELHNGIDYKGVEFISSAGEISGLIKTTESNKTIQKAIITVQKINVKDYIPGQPFQTIDTSANNGNYKIEGLNAGKYKIQVNAVGYGSLIEEVELSKSQMQKKKDFTLTQEGIISGQIVNYDPIEKIIFMVIDNNKNFYKTDDIEIKEDGKYVIKGISSGIYTIVLKWKSMLISKDSINVIAGRETSEINIILKKATGYISGSIISKGNNEPIENALIIASSENSGNYAISNEYGNYKISGLSPGTYELFVNALNYETANKSKLLLEKDKVLENIDFDLTKQKNK